MTVRPDCGMIGRNDDGMTYLHIPNMGRLANDGSFDAESGALQRTFPDDFI